MPIINQIVAGGGGSAPAHYIEKTVDANGVLVNGTTMIDLTGAINLGSYCCAFAYYGTLFPTNTSIDMSSLTTISGVGACNNMFYGCGGISSVDISSLVTISGANACNSMFSACTALTSANLNSLTTISGQNACTSMFATTGITSIDLSSLTTITGTGSCNSMFNNCTHLISAKFNSLNVISVQLSPSYLPMFGGCSVLESIEFGGLTASTFANLTNQIQYLFNSTTGSTATNGCTVHFPSNFDPSDPSHTFDASTLAGYPTFGGNASYIHVAFDLPATE